MHSCTHGNRIQNNIFFGAVKIASHRNFLRITFNFASQNLDFASQTAMRYRINSSLLSDSYLHYETCTYVPLQKHTELRRSREQVSDSLTERHLHDICLNLVTYSLATVCYPSNVVHFCTIAMTVIKLHVHD